MKKIEARLVDDGLSNRGAQAKCSPVRPSLAAARHEAQGGNAHRYAGLTTHAGRPKPARAEMAPATIEQMIRLVRANVEQDPMLERSRDRRQVGAWTRILDEALKRPGHGEILARLAHGLHSVRGADCETRNAPTRLRLLALSGKALFWTLND